MKMKMYHILLGIFCVAFVFVQLSGCEISPNLLYSKSNDVWIMADDGQMKSKLSSASAYARWAPGTKNLIAFLKFQNGYWAIHTMDNKGNNVKKLTDYICGDHFSWSPDRNWIVYESYSDGNWEIYKIKADGTSKTRLTNNNIKDEDPEWSPKGNKIAYCANNVMVKADIFIMDVDGKNPTNVTNVPNAHGAYHPMWTPNGDKIAFIGNPAFYNSSGYERLYIAEPQTGVSNWIWKEFSAINGVYSFLFTPSGDYIIYNTGKSLYLQKLDSTVSAPDVLSSFALSTEKMDVSEVNLFYFKQISSTSTSTADGLYSLTWRWKGTPNFKDTQLEQGGGVDPDY